jgi:signal transduction protein with GAF and PtsI domain
MSWLGVPLMREGEVMGVLFISRYRDYAFAKSDLSSDGDPGAFA